RTSGRERLISISRPPAGGVNGSFVTEADSIVPLVSSEYTSEGGRECRCLHWLTRSVGSGERPSQDALFVQFLLIVEDDAFGVLEQRTGEQRLSRPAARQLDRRRLGTATHNPAILGGKWVGRITFIPDQNHPAIRLENAMELRQRGGRLEPVKGLRGQHGVGGRVQQICRF